MSRKKGPKSEERETVAGKRKSLLIAVIIAVISGPAIIHIMFKVHPRISFFSAEWTAGDALGYYGILLGAIATILGVFYSIRYAQSNYRQDVVNRSLPFLTITNLLYKKADVFSSPTETEKTQNQAENHSPQLGESYKMNHFYFVIKNGVVQLREKLNAEQELLIKTRGRKAELDERGVEFTVSTGLLYTPLEIENVGNGAAVTFSIGIKANNNESAKFRYTLPFSLNVGQKCFVYYYSENTYEDNVGDYETIFSYYDILGNGYEQRFVYSIFKDESSQPCAKFQMNGSQERV